MIKYESQQIEQEVAKTVVCDICKKEFDTVKDDMDVQEFVFINFIGGFNSVFGDGAKVEADICQDCINDKLGDYLRID